MGDRKSIICATKWQPFFNLTTEAAYYFHLQQVTLDSVDKPIITALNKKAAAARYKVLRLAAHEYTHWLDHIASLWGRKLLYDYYIAMTVRENNDPHYFPAIIKAQRSIHRCTSNMYFFTKGPQVGAPVPWRWTLSIGSRFDANGKLNEKDPIPFIRFGVGDPSDDRNLIVRMPISPASLTEVRAMATEYFWVENEYTKLGEGATPADPKLWLNEYDTFLYKDDFLIYTTALHLLANHCHAKSISEILPHASSLAWIALNFPESLLDCLTIPDDWLKKWQPPNEKIDRISPLIQARDPGFIFALLCKFASRPEGANTKLWIEELLQKAMRLSSTEFEQAWISELDNTSSMAQAELTDKRFRTWMTVGAKWARRIGIYGDQGELLCALEGNSDMSLPDAITADFEPWNPGKCIDIQDGLTTIERLDFLEAQRVRLDEFVAVCGL